MVCPGLVYGGGEDELGLHPLFRSAFEKPDAPLPLYGPGNNVLPTVHINDLVAYVRGVLACVPPQRYLLACEPGGAMLRDATDAISHALASGKVASVPWEEMLARPGLSHLLMHAPMEPTPLPDGHGPDWSTVPGMTHSLGSAVKEYKARRGLEALRVVLLGPPASGKTLLAHVIEKLYGIRRVHAKAVYEWATSLPEEHPARARVDAVLKVPNRLAVRQTARHAPAAALRRMRGHSKRCE